MFLIAITLFLIVQFIINPFSVSAANPAAIGDLNGVIANIISITIALIGAVATVMVVIGGFKFLTAGGDKEAVAKAQHTLTYAFIGLILAASAWLIVSFLGTFLGIDLHTFSVLIR